MLYALYYCALIGIAAAQDEWTGTEDAEFLLQVQVHVNTSRGMGLSEQWQQDQSDQGLTPRRRKLFRASFTEVLDQVRQILPDKRNTPRFPAIVVGTMVCLAILLGFPTPFAGKLMQLAYKVGLGMAFCLVIGISLGFRDAEEWFTCYSLEFSLSIDSVFLFDFFFRSFGTNEIGQIRVLRYGILGAYVLRFLVLYFGTMMLAHSKILTLLIAVFLLYGSYHAFKEEEQHEDSGTVEQSFVFKAISSVLPVAPKDDEDNFLTTVNGQSAVTPLFVCLLFVMFSDAVFACDSVSAVISETDNYFTAYTSNVFAVGGLYALFFVLRDALQCFIYLKPAVAIIMGWIGIKLILSYFQLLILSPIASLILILTALGGGIGLSLIRESVMGKSETAKQESTTYETETSVTPTDANATAKDSGSDFTMMSTLALTTTYSVFESIAQAALSTAV